MISPFATKPAPPAWNELGAYQDVLQRIDKTPNLLQLVRGFNFRAYQYIYLLQHDLITTDGTTLTLTDVSKGYLKRYCSQRFEGGDLVTIKRMTPRQGRVADTYGHWKGFTDDEYVLSIYPEDMKVIQKAGYTVPEWNSKETFQCDIPVIVSREIQASGWRIVSVEPHMSAEELAEEVTGK